jgi:hypothetical protein
MTTTTRFAALEAKANAALLRHLANAQATVAGQALQGIFDNEHAVALGGPFDGMGVSTTQPRLTCATASLPADPAGAAVVVGVGNYVVAEHQPDGTGISVLVLRRAA